jgi:acetyltransferase-like isoleucine patch superfamily enzyme
MSIGDHSRIDDFCVLAGSVTIGRNVHLAALCNVAGGRAGVTFEDFSGLAYGCQVIAQSDDYSGRTMTNPTVPARFKDETSSPVVVGRHAILGAGAIVLPGVTIAEGVSAGAGTIFTRSTEPWTIYVGSPARAVRPRSRDLLTLEQEYLLEQEDLAERDAEAEAPVGDGPVG